MRPLFAILPFLMNAATDHGDGGGGGEQPLDPAVALEQVEDATIPFSQRLKIAAAALKGVGPTAQFAEVQQQLTTANETIALRDAELVTVKGQLSAATQNVTDLEARNVTLETEAKDLRAKEQDLEKRATARSNEKLAALGFPAGKLPAANEQAGSTADEKIAALRADIAAAKTPQERGALITKIRALQQDASQN